jgi:site-specific recombinase XerD
LQNGASPTPICKELKTALERYVGERERQKNIIDAETVFLARNGTSLNPSSIRKLVKKYYAKARVRKSGVHTLRHTFSAHNVNNGMSIADLQKILGHKKKETTLKYIHVVNTSLRETMLKTQA